MKLHIWIVDKILSKKCLWTIFLTCWMFVGIILSIFDTSLKNNYVYVLGVNTLLFAQVITYHNLMNKESNLSFSISGVTVSGYPIFSIVSRFGAHLQQWYSIAFSFIIGIVYVASLLLLKVLTWNQMITSYGSLTLIFTVFIAIQLYLKYIFYILTLRKISKLDFTTFTPISLHNPSEADWIVRFTENMNSFSNYFGVLGIAYTLLFYLTTPLSAISFSNNRLRIDTPNNIAFVITWGIIVVLIGLGYILFDCMWKTYIKIIIRKIKRKRLLDWEVASSNQTQLDSNYLELFNWYKTVPDFPVLFNEKYINPLGYIPLIINAYKVIAPFLSQK
ncbi:hypothetical protein PCO15_10185 [Streptococcus suis]|nr:hypothetical protein [Streptococcus suis]EGJ27143.1 putative membrane protein [Streptococcus porcinus str. Jelinkova 176]MDN2989298.1 hypothetical protein [Streptococcus suis]MDN2990807.1 hypothetical protein [Streptococcus suis]MDS1313757.1 hypothetical protein [Streptococcus suis]